MASNKNVNFIPAGLEESDDENYYYNGDSEEKEPRDLPPPSAHKQKISSMIQETRNGNVEELKKLLDDPDPDHDPELKTYNIDEDVEGGWNLLQIACHEAQAKVVEFLLSERGSNINCFSNELYTPMMIVCMSTKDSSEVLEVAKILVKHSVNISVSNCIGKTALMMACESGHLSTVEYLVSLGDNIQALDNNRSNALFYAVREKQIEIAKFLINNGIDTSTEDRYRRTVRDIAVGKKLVEILELLPTVEENILSTEYTNYNYQNMIPGIAKTESPLYFPDVVNMLYSMKCEKYTHLFAEAKVGLEQFMTISDKRLKEIGIEYPFERNIIRLALLRFHTEPWSKDSLFIPKSVSTNSKEISEYELIVMVANLLRQMTVIKAHLIYMQQFGIIFNLNNIAAHFRMEQLQKFQCQIEDLKKKVQQNLQIAKPQRPLLINGTKMNSKSSICGAFRYQLFKGIIGVFSIFNFA